MTPKTPKTSENPETRSPWPVIFVIVATIIIGIASCAGLAYPLRAFFLF